MPLTAAAQLRQAWRLALMGMVGGIAGLLAAHIDTLAALTRIWATLATYRYNWVILPTLAYLLWVDRQRLTAAMPTASPFGVALAALASLLWIASDLFNVTAGQQFALVTAITAIVLAAVGWRAFWRLAPFLILLILLIPAGDFLITPLKHLTVTVIEGFTTLSGLPFRGEGFTVYIAEQRYLVIDECAGLAFLLIGLFLGAVYALLLHQTPWKIAALTLLGGALGVGANALRVIGIVTVDYLLETKMDLADHSYFQWGALVLTVMLLIALAARLTPEKIVATTASGEAAESAQKPRWRVIVWPLLAAAIAAISPSLVDKASPASATPASGQLLPDRLLGWRRLNTATDWSPTAHSTLASEVASYDRPGNPVAVFTVVSDSRRGEVSGGSVDLIGDSAWRLALQQHTKACADGSCQTVQHVKLLLRNSDRVRHVYTTHALGNDLIAAPVELRLRRAWATLRGASSPARLLAVATDASQGLNSAELAQILKVLARHGD